MCAESHHSAYLHQDTANNSPSQFQVQTQSFFFNFNCTSPPPSLTENYLKCATLFVVEVLTENYSFNCNEMECIAQRKMENSLKAIKAEIATSNVDVVLSDFYLMSRKSFKCF